METLNISEITQLKEKIASFQLENDLLLMVAHSIQQEVLKVEYENKTLISNIELLENNFVTSDSELAHLIYGEKLAMTTFTSSNVSKGVLMTCKRTSLLFFIIKLTLFILLLLLLLLYYLSINSSIYSILFIYLYLYLLSH